jgi:hypothetical protein
MGGGRTIGEAGGEVERDGIVELVVHHVDKDLFMKVGLGHQKEEDGGRVRSRVIECGRGMGYKTSKGTGSLCELKPTSATRTFQSDCGAFGRQCGFRGQ